MCGRFVSTSSRDVLADWFGVDEVRTDDLGENYNVAPTDPVYAVADHDGRRLLGTFRWGLVPPSAADPARASKPINARIETALERSTFRDAFLHRRCLVAADGFYEWEQQESGRKQPWFFRAADGEPLAFAGLWSVWRATDGSTAPLRTCTILTTSAEGPVARLHARMPVAVSRDRWDRWLDPASEPPELALVLDTPPLTAHRVSTRVNDVRNNGPELLEAPA